jgi:hypothetical protein
MDDDVLERARRRLASLQAGQHDEPALQAALVRAREQLEALANTAADLEGTMPERLGSALQEALRTEVSPVARNLAEVRGLSAQGIRRLERLEHLLETERRSRVEDLSLLVELIASGWRGVDRRLDRIERALDRIERDLEREPAAAELLRLDEHRAGDHAGA